LLAILLEGDQELPVVCNIKRVFKSSEGGTKKHGILMIMDESD